MLEISSLKRVGEVGVEFSEKLGVLIEKDSLGNVEKEIRKEKCNKIKRGNFFLSLFYYWLSYNLKDTRTFR